MIEPAAVQEAHLLPRGNKGKASKSRLVFTDAWLKGLKGTGKRVVYADLGRRGLFLRVGPTGVPTFYAVCRVKRGPFLRKHLGVYPERCLSDAREMAQDVGKLARKGIDVREVERTEQEEKARTERLKESREKFDLAGMCRWYIEDREEATKKPLAKKTALNYRALASFYLDGPKGGPFRGRFAGEVPAFEIRELLKTVAKSSATQANRLFELIRAAYRHASYEGRLESVPSLKRPADNPTRDRVLTQKEIRAFWNAVNTARLLPRKKDPKKPGSKVALKSAKAKPEERKSLSPQARGVLRMLLVLGQRKGETVAMRWADVDETVWRIPGRFRKGGRTHSVPLSSLAVEIIEQLRPVTGTKERVFDGVSATNLHGRAFRAVRDAVVKEQKSERFSIHDLRRTFATQARELCGVSPDVLGDCLGHKRGKFAAPAVVNYDKSTGRNPMESAFEAWGETARKIVAGEIIGGEKGKILAFR